MKNKDSYLYLECLLTIFLLFLVISLLARVLSTYNLYLILGLIFGFGFSVLSHKKTSHPIRPFITIATLGTFAGIIYALLNSSFLYKEVIIIWIKGILVLEVILSFNACSAAFLNYIQALSIPLFMSHPLFIRDYNATSVALILGYFIGWLAILKVKFYGLLNITKRERFKQHYSVPLSITFFIITIFIAWLLVANIQLEGIRKGGLFLEKGVSGDIELGEALEEEYYGLQDKIEKEINRLIPKLQSTEDKNNLLFLLSSLVQESTYTLEVDKAQQGLISFLNTPELGLEKKDSEGLTILIKDYMDKKVSLNLKRTKDSIIDMLKKYPLGIKTRILVLSRINKMQFENSYQKLLRQDKDLKDNISNSSLDYNAKRELKELARIFKEWKMYDLYRKQLDALDKKINSLEEAPRKEFADIVMKVAKLENLSEYEELYTKLSTLKETRDAQLKDLIKNSNEISDLKSALQLEEKNSEVKEKLDSAPLSWHEKNELKEVANNITDAKEYKSLSKSYSEFKQKMEEENIAASQDLRELLEMKTYFLVKHKGDKIEDLLKESVLPDGERKDFLHSLKPIELSLDREKLSQDAQKLEEKTNALLNKGFISQETKEALEKEIVEVTNLIVYKRGMQEKEFQKEASSLNAQTKWEEAIDKSSAKEDTKETLKRLTEELAQAKTLVKVEALKEQIEKELSRLSEGEIKREVKRFKETFEAAIEVKRIQAINSSLANLKKNIEKLKEIDAETSGVLDEHLEKIRKSSTEEEFRKRLDALNEYIYAKELKQKKEEYPHTGELYPWEIYIMPKHVVIPRGSSVSLKAILVYNRVFIKEVGLESEWLSTEPHIAMVDEKGTLRALSQGKTRISATYRGRNTEGTEVIVVDKIAEAIEDDIKSSVP